MAQLYNGVLKKTDDWGGIINSAGKRLPASGKAVLKFIKDSLQKRIGYIYEDELNKKYIGFADQEDCNNYFNTNSPSFHDENLIVQIWDLPKSGIGYIYEGTKSDGNNYYGYYFGFIDEDDFLEWVLNNRPVLSELIKLKWSSLKPDVDNLKESISLLLGNYYEVPNNKRMITKYKRIDIKNSQGNSESVYIAIGVLEDAKPCIINFISRRNIVNTITATEGSIITLFTPQIDKIEFEGWYTNSLYIGIKHNAGSSYTVIGDVDFYGKWAINNEYLLIDENQLRILNDNSINYSVALEEEIEFKDLEGWNQWINTDLIQYIIFPKKENSCSIEDYLTIQDEVGGDLTPGFIMNCPEGKSYVTIRWKRNTKIDYSDANAKIKFNIDET